MATGTNAIATREDVNNKNPGVYTDDLKRCITFNSAGAAGLGVLNIDRYKSNPNRLVRYSDLIASTIIFQFVINVSSDSSLYDKGPITLNTNGVADNSSEAALITLTKGSNTSNLLKVIETVYNGIISNDNTNREQIIANENSNKESIENSIKITENQIKKDAEINKNTIVTNSNTNRDIINNNIINAKNELNTSINTAKDNVNSHTSSVIENFKTWLRNNMTWHT